MAEGSPGSEKSSEEQRDCGFVQAVEKVYPSQNITLLSSLIICGKVFALIGVLLATLHVGIMAHSDTHLFTYPLFLCSHPGPQFSCSTPPILLMARSLANIEALSSQDVLLIVAIIVASLVAIFGILAQLAEKRVSVPALIVIIIITAFSYDYQIPIWADMSLDKSTPVVFKAKVLEKGNPITIGRGARSSYLTLAPWGPYQTNHSSGVELKLFFAVKTGDNVCLQTHPGAFDIPWYVVSLCQ